MKIYIDTNDGFKCYVSDKTGTMLEFEEVYFDDKCQTFIEGYMCKPEGYTYIRDDGEVFDNGIMVASWKPHSELDVAQREYEAELFVEMKKDLAELDAALLDAQYNMLMEGL